MAPAARVVAELAASSPFLPPNLTGSDAPAGGPSGPVELRGIMATSEGSAYCIYDSTKKTSTWVGLNEKGNEFVVRSADAAGDSITVDYQGRNLRLVLRTAKVASLGNLPSGGPPGNPALTSSVVFNPTPADEQKRLDAVAAEVRRRRLEREKAFQASANGGVGPGAPSPPNR
jgi:hypothetical protein